MKPVTTLPRSRPLTRHDLAAMPDDGHRYELVDGTLVVSPAPRLLHQRVVTRLAALLLAHCPDEMEVLAAPFDVVLAEDTVVQPDLLVAWRADLTERDLSAPPALAVEVLSASTRRIDLLLKHSRYAAAGVASYWIVDPDLGELIAWELDEGAYVEVARVDGEASFRAMHPFEVEVRPVSLVGH